MKNIFPHEHLNPVAFQKLLLKNPESYWMKLGEKQALYLFREMSRRVPAYQDFIRKNKITPTQIKTIDDFQKIPPIDKNNYLRVYPRNMLSWDGKFRKQNWIISSTSGSTGEPYYFPRTDLQDRQYAFIAELYLRNNFDIQNKSTLYIDAFAMGAWIGGVFTYQAIKYVSQNNRNKLSIITPGINKKEIYHAIQNLSCDFDQILIGGYPPFIKDLIDEGRDFGIKWNKYKLGFVFSAEGFSEDFRDYILDKTGIKDPFLSSLNHYGTVDMGTMAHETPYTILLRRQIRNNSRINQILFNNKEYQPTVAQYIPELYYFEQVRGNLYCTSNSGLPLVRYDLKDQGGIYSMDKINETLKLHNIDINCEIKLHNLSDKIWNLPIVYLRERSDFVVKLNAANIYPSSIRKVLCRREFAEKYTGKFTMIVNNNQNQNQFLEINIEMKRNTSKKLSDIKLLTQKIIKQLLDENSEYHAIYDVSPSRQIPHIVLWKYGDNKYFAAGGKQKWVK
jgi:phenylacetate-CoA ligase